MSKLSKYATKDAAAARQHEGTVVENFMGGNSYKLDPIQTLKIVAASSIFGEPQFYRDGIETPKTIFNRDTIKAFSILESIYANEQSMADVFINTVDKALDYDFKATLDLTVTLRQEYFMRLNPAVIYIRAMKHKDRAEFNNLNPGYMKAVGKKIAQRPDDITNQFDYYMYINGSKNKMPSVLKRTWADSIESYSRYQLNKYKTKSLIDLVRISHANNEDINELMKTGTLKVADSEQTWESLRSAGKPWTEILATINIPHMALLRNLRNIFTEISNSEQAHEILSRLKKGVLNGKQFPFRYFSAFKMIEKSDVNCKQLILDSLEECLDISVANMPKLKGKIACLSDNSGSAWGTFPSEFGTVTVAEIANLSSLITAYQADEGYVGVFGDNISMKQVSTRNGLLTQLTETCARGEAQGQATENGIWLFWDSIIKNKVHYDTIFIYSDMQAGHGGLFGNNPKEYKDFIFKTKFHHGHRDMIDVLALVNKYRKTVNPKVNVFSVQVGGYDNSILPENLYRGAILAGWTGKEPIYAKAIIDAWDSFENK